MVKMIACAKHPFKARKTNKHSEDLDPYDQDLS
jgi:hypothetical protein